MSRHTFVTGFAAGDGGQQARMSDDPEAGRNIDPDDPRSKMAPVTSDPGHPQPEAAEVESARLLFNDTKDRLMGDGIREDDVRRLAGEYVALDKAGGARSSDDFVAWARERRTTRSD